MEHMKEIKKIRTEVGSINRLQVVFAAGNLSFINGHGLTSGSVVNLSQLSNNLNLRKCNIYEIQTERLAEKNLL